jgi:uncharacterized protein (TIGR03067 family)
MRAATWWGASGLVLAACVLGADADDKKDKFDAAKLVGTWTYVSGEKNGEKVDKSHFTDSKVILTKDKITLEGPSGKFVIEYTLDTAKSPVTISMKMTESPFGAGATAKGIVEVKGDELKLCYATMGDTPAKFATKADSNQHLFVLKRSKK